MTDRRSIRVQFIYRIKENEQFQKEYTPALFTLSEGETMIWDAHGTFVATHISFEVPDWSYNIEEAKRQGVEEYKNELRALGVDILRERLEEILVKETEYEYD